MKHFITLAFIILGSTLQAQITITGKVTDKNGLPLAGANIAVKGTYDGTATDSAGCYTITTGTNQAVLVASFMGYIPKEQEVTNGGTTIINFSLKKQVNHLGDVVISAGTFETADRKRSVTLQPLDIVTTPSAVGDLYGALTTLPGTAPIGEDGRLFVRGGDGYESKTFVDGLLSKKPYQSRVPDLPGRGRFSPFLFSGTTFSTGGYSAEYGQALSSALILNSNALPSKTQTDLSIMSVGGGLTQTVRRENASISAGFEYFNLTPYNHLTKQQFLRNKHPESLGLTLVARKKTGQQGMLKLFSTYAASETGLRYPDFTVPGSMTNIHLKNNNSYTNLTYSDELGKGWLLKGGVSFTMDNNRLDLQRFEVDENNENIQAKVILKKSLAANASLLFGLEETYNRFGQDYLETSGFKNRSHFNDLNSAQFAEADYRPFHRIALRAGLRTEQSTLLDDTHVAARFSAAVKITGQSQLSVATGSFVQTPEEGLLRFTHQLEYEKANHHIVNYQWEDNGRIFRAEMYLKEYKDLVTYDGVNYWDGVTYQNAGKGLSKGVDIFYRDRKAFRTMEYWISYSFVDAKRLYRDYPQMVQPPFAPKHTASVVAKKWIQSITTQVGLSTTISTGRPFNNPNSPKFMDGRTNHYHDISINCSHLRSLWGMPTILYASINNLTGRNNIFGYRYYSQPNADGRYEAFPIRRDSKRFYFIGLFITL